MGHPTEGVLRRLLDEPSGVADPDREHVEACPTCRAEVAAAREDATRVRAALDPADPARSTDPAVDDAIDDAALEAAWDRLAVALATGAPRPIVGPPRRRTRLRAAARRPVVAGVAAVLVVAGAGAAAAGDWLDIFRTEEITPI
jgi:hypothetical protein